MEDAAADRQLHLLVVVADEAYHHQEYSKAFLAKVQEAFADSPIQLGWSRQTVLDALADTSIVTVDVRFDGDDLSRYYIPHDDHTSGEGHRVIATQVAKFIDQQAWIGPATDQ